MPQNGIVSGIAGLCPYPLGSLRRSPDPLLQQKGGHGAVKGEREGGERKVEEKEGEKSR